MACNTIPLKAVAGLSLAAFVAVAVCSSGRGATVADAAVAEVDRAEAIKLVKQYNDYVDALIEKVRAADPKAAGDERKSIVKAMEALAAARAERAVPILIDKLTYHVNEYGIVPRIAPPDLEDLYPALRALVRIGRPALPQLADAIVQRAPEEQFDMVARSAIRRIIGDSRRTNEYLRDRVKLYDSGGKRLGALIVEP